MDKRSRLIMGKPRISPFDAAYHLDNWPVRYYFWREGGSYRTLLRGIFYWPRIKIFLGLGS